MRGSAVRVVVAAGVAGAASVLLLSGVSVAKAPPGGKPEKAKANSKVAAGAKLGVGGLSLSVGVDGGPTPPGPTSTPAATPPPTSPPTSPPPQTTKPPTSGDRQGASKPRHTSPPVSGGSGSGSGHAATESHSSAGSRTAGRGSTRTAEQASAHSGLAGQTGGAGGQESGPTLPSTTPVALPVGGAKSRLLPGVPDLFLVGLLLLVAFACAAYLALYAASRVPVRTTVPVRSFFDDEDEY